MIRKALAKENRKTTGKVFLVLCILAILLAGSLPVTGQNVFANLYGRDVVMGHYGYVRNGVHYTYTDNENSWIMLTNSHDNDYIVLKFREEAEADMPVQVREFTEDNILQSETEAVWEAGKGFVEMRIANPDTAYVELYIPGDFTVDRSFYAVRYQRYKRSALFFGIVAVIVLLATLFLAGSRPGQAFLAWLGSRKKAFRRIFERGRMRRHRLEWVTFILILVIGGLYSFLEPPFTGMCWDDEFHYTTSIRYGHIYSSAVSASDYDVMFRTVSRNITSEIFKWEERGKYSRYLNEIDRRGYIMVYPERKPVRISTLPYIPYLIPLLMMKTLHVPWTIRFMIGRWVYVWFLAIFTVLGMRRLKSGKLVAALIALTPGVIFLAGNYSYDTWITALYLYGMCCVFGELQKQQEPIGLKTSGKIFASLALAGIPKPVYFPINAIAFFMPRNKFRTKKGYWYYKLAAVCCVAFPILLTWLNTFGQSGGIGVGDARGGSAVNAAVQVQLAIQEPGRFAHVILNFLKGYLNPFGFGKGWSSSFAYLGNLNIGGLVFILILVGVVVSWARKEPGKFPWWYRLGLLFVYFAIGAIATVSMYVSFTPVGSDTVLGAQPRYLTPVMFPTIYGVTRLSGGKVLTNKTFQTVGHVVLLAAMAALNVYAIWSLCLVLY